MSVRWSVGPSVYPKMHEDASFAAVRKIPAGFQLVSILTYFISDLSKMVPAGFQLVSNRISLHFETLKRVKAGFQLGSSWVPVGSKSD